MNKIKCPHGISPKSNCDICYKESRKKYSKRFRQSQKYREYQKEYEQSSKYKEYQKEYRKNYRRLHNQKVLSHAPAKPTVTGGVHGCNRIGSNEPFTAQGRGATWETGGRLNSKVKNGNNT